MQTFVGLLVLSLALAANGASLNSRINGGEDAPEGKYPYQVSLWMSNRMFLCGGSIINSRYILTAAHAVSTFSANDVSVVVGSNSLKVLGTRYQAEKIITHEGFSYDDAKDDIALIRLSEEIVYSDNVQPVQLPTEDYNRQCSCVVLTGWGRLFDGGPQPTYLQEIDLKVIDLKDCQKLHPYVTSNHICTHTKRNEAACHGDSGGPLVSDDIQIGIVSFGKKCGLDDYPDVYTRVQSYIGWISDNMEL